MPRPDPISPYRERSGVANNAGRRTRRKFWLLRRNQKNLRRRIKLRKRGPAGKSPSLPVNKYTARSVSTDRGKLVIELPESLDFDDNYEVTVSHLGILRQAVEKRRPVRSLVFSALKYISPSAALVLASEVDRWNQALKGARMHANLPTWHEEIKRLLCEMGYFELLKLQTPTFDESPKNVEFLKFKRGVTGGNAGALAKEFRIAVEELVGRSIRKHFLFDGLSEAITNVGQHAYPDPAFFKQWWLSASVDRKDNSLCVMFYDQGVGIPTTLPKAHFFEGIKEFFGSWPDSEKIQAAMRGGRSATEKLERGKGLRNFIDFASSHRLGRLSIYSQRGMYRMFWKKGSKEPYDTVRRDHENSIGGTLIEWLITF